MKKAWIVALSILSIILFGIVIVLSASLNYSIPALQKKNEQLESSVSSLQAIVNATQKSIEVADLYSGINKQRTNRGLTALKIDHRLEVSACAKALDMSAKDYWAHIAPDGTTPWDLITSAGYRYSEAGENLAKDYSTAGDVIKGWLDSPSHLKNIVGDYKDAGICIIQTNQPHLSESTKPINVIVNHFGR